MKKKDTKAPPKRKKERNVMVCPAVPSREKKERDGSNWIFKLQKKKRTERETERVLASRKSRKSRSP